MALLLAYLAFCFNFDRAVTSRVEHLVKRTSYVPGWALVSDDCPLGTGFIGRACCPAGKGVADDRANSVICCVGNFGTGCIDEINLNSPCASSDWVLWTTVLEPICCLPGQIGIQPQPGEYFGHCVDGNTTVAAASSATRIGSNLATANYQNPALLPHGALGQKATSTPTISTHTSKSEATNTSTPTKTGDAQPTDGSPTSAIVANTLGSTSDQGLTSSTVVIATIRRTTSLGPPDVTTSSTEALLGVTSTGSKLTAKGSTTTQTAVVQTANISNGSLPRGILCKYLAHILMIVMNFLV